MRKGNFASSVELRALAGEANSDYLLLCLKREPVTLGYRAVERMEQVARQTGAKWVYADRYAVKNGQRETMRCLDYQLGSVRNDFDMGSLLLIETEALRQYLKDTPDADWKYAALYDFRLYVSRMQCVPVPILHLGELLYTEEEKDVRKSGEKQFDYVDPRNREAQIEYEQACTLHLKKIGAWVDVTTLRNVVFAHSETAFGCEASVIIPVRNRVRTIEDAVRSALSQNTSFNFNVIVVDNYSTDGTTEVLKRLSDEDRRVVHIVPERTDLGIGGCWSLAVNDARCGRFAIQLDSDDLYSGAQTLQRVVDEFHRQQCAMLVGSYRMCDFQLKTLPPGVIDHKEWTYENGMNNALRINGLGAPRAFYTPLLREIGVPNTSYGEDYALGLAFSRRYKIGRIYDELYLCRRWEGNSDAALSPEKVNANNLYKDSLRTMEILARQQMIKARES
ncbi:MAG: glycosyltransferase family 2 protein [Bacteroidaceae bacterium]|nr:glycosyltransferase family 2 protein [Bacteroidaceae bacterium]